MADSAGKPVSGGKARRSMERWAKETDAKLKAAGLCDRLLTRAAVLPGEDVDDLAHLVEQLHGELLPAGELERWLVDRVAGSLWRLRRVYAIEAGLCENQIADMDAGVKPVDTRRSELQRLLARAYGRECGNGVAINQLHMYESAIERSLYKALHELKRLQAGRGACPNAPAALDVSVSEG
ncbi:MAG: hypothetical protein GF320_09150 [Armatimonadia bacterium]|nr:hypothetical protein [Armatimonadia bacterium]